MPLQPRDADSIYSRVQSRLTDAIDGISNFLPGSFNNAFLDAHSEQVREAEIKALAAELAGYVDYAGKTLTQDDLDDLGISGVAPGRINEYMADEDLDLLAQNFGVTRDTGERARGTVEITVLDDTVELEEGTAVSTSLRGGDDQLDFFLDVDGDGEITTNPPATTSAPAGETTVEVDVIADEPGSEYNVGIDAINRIPVPQPGVESVTNRAPTTGGEDPQSNASLRNDVQTVLLRESGGGTESGIRGYIKSNASQEISSVGINEFDQQQPPFVDVVVDGGDETELSELIAESKPVGIEHNLVRPTRISLGVDGDVLVDTEVDETTISDGIIQELSRLDIGDDFYQSQLQRVILNTNANVLSGPAVNTSYETVTKEIVTYDSADEPIAFDYGPLGYVAGEQHVLVSGKTVYPLSFDQIDTSTFDVSVVENGVRTEVPDTAYTGVDTTGSGNTDAVEITDGSYITDRSILTVGYEHSSWGVDSIEIEDESTVDPNTALNLVDNDGDGFIDSFEWTDAGTQPSTGQRIFIDYTPKRVFNTDAQVDDTTIFRAEDNEIHVSVSVTEEEI